MDAACLTWRQLFTSWFNAIKTEPWLENHDVILQQLFQWLLPPLLSCISTCRCFPPPPSPAPSNSLLSRLAAPISSLNLVQGSLDLFQVLLQEALPNLKERKYLRGWIQVSFWILFCWRCGLGGGGVCLHMEPWRLPCRWGRANQVWPEHSRGHLLWQ